MNVRAYAKINIGLRILGERPDGYHDIETTFRQIDLYDKLVLEPSATVTLTTSSASVPSDSRNLCVQAAELFRERTGCSDGIAIRLDKRIPVGAGLGGGSSDAAAILVSLNSLWNTGLSSDELESMASQLGSDVPFFIRGGTAVGTSRGEVLEHFELDIPFWIVTVTPPIHVSTAWAYSNVHARKTINGERLRSVIETSVTDPGEIQVLVLNDFEELVYRTYPEIHRLKERIQSGGAVFAQLSGSGSSVYGFFREELAARKAMMQFAPPMVTSLTAPDFNPNK
ncbi:MAG TPA: 4-(cytidine 5'-diphospho)-2-C-methyl-D-erythritol kinase [Bacteroidota bacterium]